MIRHIIKIKLYVLIILSFSYSDEIINLCQKDEIKQKLIGNTEKAVSKGVFGAPSIFVDNEMYFGQDRLFWVEKALK